MGTSSTGAMPVQTSEVTETVEEVKEPNEASVPMSYQDFRAKIPAEVSDEIVQLIYYNQNAFADFAQITTQADVYAFNNKYGVSLVLPMQTEMT
jgi:Ni,Fe-hydrogenase III component G